jgi:hypothetical protein
MIIICRPTAPDKATLDAWVEAISGAIRSCGLDSYDPLCREAVARLKDEDELYSVTFTAKTKDLGVVLEKSGDWALVKVGGSGGG